MSDPDTVPRPERQFPLVIDEREKRFVFKFENEGVALNDSGLAWSCDGVAHTRSYGDIAAIHLRVIPTPGELTGQCRITFGGGAALNVMSWKPSGFADAGRAKLYREFVTALHARLSPADRARIAFTSGSRGSGPAWRVIGAIAFVAAVLLFVVTPLGLALIVEDQRGYGLAFGGAILTSGLYWQLRRSNAVNEANTPQTYAPDHVPAALLP